VKLASVRNVPPKQVLVRQISLNQARKSTDRELKFRRLRLRSKLNKKNINTKVALNQTENPSKIFSENLNWLDFHKRCLVCLPDSTQKCLIGHERLGVNFFYRFLQCTKKLDLFIRLNIFRLCF
jgi:hypothetical protein